MRCLVLLAAVIASGVSGAHERFRIDPAQTIAHFKIGYLEFMTINGRIDATKGRIYLDRQHHDSRLSVTLDPATLSTGSAKRDRRLKNQPNLFDVARYPSMRFQSTDIHFDAHDPTKATAYGRLTLHGVTKPIRLDVDDVHCGQRSGAGNGALCRMTAKTQINRKRFGMTGLSMIAKDTVHITIDVRAVRARRVGS